MAVIKIPSKNIYEKDNQKVIDNAIDKIEVNCLEISTHADSGTVNTSRILVDKFNTGSAQYSQESLGQTNYNSSGQLTFTGSGAYLLVQPYYKQISIEISELQKNFVILSILTGIDSNNNNNIQCSIYGNRSTAKQNGTLEVLQGSYETGFSYNFILGDVTEEKIESNVLFDLSPYENEITYTFNPTLLNPYIRPITVLTSISDFGNIGTKSFDKKNNKFVANFTVFCGLAITTLGAEANNWGANDVIDNKKYYTVPAYGTRQEYTPTEMVLTFHGEMIKVDIDNKIITIGNGKNIMSFQGNELIQTTNSPSLETQYQAVINEWQNGKEMATLTCDIADYYDEAGNLVISANGKDTLPMTFHIGDTVVPYVYGANGADKPMSTYADGTPKVFTVIGKHTSKSGAVWQEITLQEKTD